MPSFNIFFNRKHIVAALPYLNSNAAVNVMIDLIIKNYVNRMTVNDWIVNFALFPQPDRDTIKALSKLLDFPNQLLHVQFILSYSTIIHTYCKNNDDCMELEEVDMFLSRLHEKLSENCEPRFHSSIITKDVRYL